MDRKEIEARVKKHGKPTIEEECCDRASELSRLLVEERLRTVELMSRVKELEKKDKKGLENLLAEEVEHNATMDKMTKLETRWEYIKTDPDGARALLLLLREEKGTAEDFDTMIDRIIESRQALKGDRNEGDLTLLHKIRKIKIIDNIHKS